jgi:hypothetical protein
MLKLVGWTTTALVLVALIWQSAAAEPLWPRAISGLLIAFVSLLAGIRIGTDAATAYTKDLHRLNKVLTEQNHALQEANAIVLQQAAEESRASRASSQVNNP